MNPTKTRDALRNLTTRDKESMIEEIAQLKKALLEKDAELRRRKIYATNVESENRYHEWTYIAFKLSIGIIGYVMKGKFYNLFRIG